MNRIGVLLVTAFLLVPVAVPADQVSCELAKRIASDGAVSDLFGSSVSISGEFGLVGAWRDDDNGTDSGSVYVYHRDGIEWVEETKLTASDGAADDHFGGPNALFGNIALVGSGRDDDNGTDSGSAYIFRFDGSGWVEEAKLTASDGSAGDFFGINVSLFGDTALIGAMGDDDNGTDSGSAYIFKYDGNTWVEEAKLTAADGAAGDSFGSRGSLSGDTALIGAMNDDDNGTDSGSVYVFRHDGSGWVEEAKLTAADGAAADGFGNQISLSSDIALIAATWDDDNGPDSGSAYVFRYDGGGWVEEAKLTAAGAAAGDWFGMSTSISGDLALVGIRYDDDRAHDAGSVRIFKYDGSGWNEEAQLLASDGQADDHFGHSVALSGDIVMVGARDDDDNGSYSGSVYFFGVSAIECGTIFAELQCEPQAGVVPFQTNMNVRIFNNYNGWSRIISGRLDVTLASGRSFPDWRAGYFNVAAGSGIQTRWNTTIPALGFTIGSNVFTLVVEDVTSAPYNQPPYPPAGDTATATCTVTGFAP